MSANVDAITKYYICFTCALPSIHIDLWALELNHLLLVSYHCRPRFTLSLTESSFSITAIRINPPDLGLFAMAYCEPYTGYSADYSNVSYSSNEHPSSLYHAGVNPPWPITASASPSFTALSNRVGALEEQLAKTLAEQTETHLVLQCLIRGQADALNKAVGATKFNQSISALRYKLVRAKQANRVLQATLRLVFPILKHDHPCSTINKCQLGTFSNPHHVLRTKIATPPITEDLIDLFTSSESTAVDNSEKDAASSVHALGKEDGANEAYTSDGEEAPHRELATHDSIEVFQDQYVYRFGHVAGGNALNIDTSREQSPNKDTKQVTLASNNLAQNPTLTYRIVGFRPCSQHAKVRLRFRGYGATPFTIILDGTS